MALLLRSLICVVFSSVLNVCTNTLARGPTNPVLVSAERQLKPRPNPTSLLTLGPVRAMMLRWKFQVPTAMEALMWSLAGRQGQDYPFSKAVDLNHSFRPRWFTSVMTTSELPNGLTPLDTVRGHPRATGSGSWHS